MVRPAAHVPGPVDVRVSWSRQGRDSGTVILPYTYMPLGHRVVFDPGNGGAVSAQDVDEWGRVSRPVDPVRSGFVFDGWFRGDAAWDFSRPVTGDVTLTGRWSRPGAWTRTPASGPTGGGTGVTLAPPSGVAGGRLAGVSAGGSHSLGVSGAGRVYAWGGNDRGQLGDGTRSGHADPAGAAIPAGVTVTQARAGRDYSVALDTAGRVWTWGDNTSGQLGRGSVGGDDPTPAPAATGATRFTQVSAGDAHVLALDTDGRVWSWGADAHGQLGDGGAGGASGTPAMRSMPSRARFTQVQAGGAHSLAVAGDGGLYAWGDDTHGQLGDNRTGVTSTATPVAVRAPSDAARGFAWLGLAAGGDHSLAVGTSTDTGSVYGFGSDRQGQLGDGRTGVDAALPVRPSLPTGAAITGLSAGGASSQALTGTGLLYAWGANDKGQLGDGTTTGRATPVGITIPTRAGAWADTSIGAGHALGIDSAGGLRSWGGNDQGQLGDGTSTGRTTPVTVAFPVLKVTGVDFDTTPGAGLTRRADGSWGVASPARRHRPGLVPLRVHWTLGGAVQPDTVLDFTYTPARYTVTWEADGGTPAPSPATLTVDEDTILERPTAPTRAGRLFDGWFDGETAWDFTRPVEHDMTLKARWSLQGGRWTISPDHGADAGGDTITLTPPPARGVRLAALTGGGGTHALGLGSDGRLYAWGGNTDGQLGDGTRTERDRPVTVHTPAGAPAGSTWTQASAGDTHTTAIDNNGDLYTWGALDTGLGDQAATTGSPTPVKVATPTGAPAGFRYTHTAAGDGYSLAVGNDGNLYAWGALATGLGDQAGTTVSPTPIRAATPAGAPAGFRYLRAWAGERHALALGDDGHLYAWGANTNGQTGQTPTGTPTRTPTRVSDPAGTTPRYLQASAGRDHNLALDDQGRAWAWGDNDDDTNGPTPVQVPAPAGSPAGTGYTAVATGRYHSMALADDHTIQAWGSNYAGQLGDGTTTNHTRPAPVLTRDGTPLKADTIATGMATGMATGTDGNTWTWGLDTFGQTGTGRRNNTRNATRAAIPAQGEPTNILIDGQTTTNTTRENNGTWTTRTPEHDPGTTNVRIQWTLAGQPQPDDTTNTYTYTHVGHLPHTGGTGILLLLIAGLLTMSGTQARKRQKQQHTTNTSHE
ncbi:RCC1 domain-containing protein [Bifidobacterium indicum]|uniref:RCC1 domain-containing protein n=1 Tax=Bifidobacterium indicum TaxID=1691 RepID=UPI0030D86072